MSGLHVDAEIEFWICEWGQEIHRLAGAVAECSLYRLDVGGRQRLCNDPVSVAHR